MKQKFVFNLLLLGSIAFSGFTGSLFVTSVASAQGRPAIEDRQLEAQAAAAVPVPGTSEASKSAASNAIGNQVIGTEESRGGFQGIINCGKATAPGDPEGEPCTACHFIVAGKGLLDYLISIMVVVAVAVTFAMGIFYILSGVNADLKKQAKEGLWAVVIGLVFMLSAWLIVSTVLFYLASDGFVKGDSSFLGVTKGEGAFGLSCSLYSAGNKGQLTKSGTIYGLRSGTSGAGGSGESYGNVGVCQPGQPAGNPCSPESLASTCFGGSNVNTWSAICQAESNGNVSIPSSTDKCAGDPVSFGLFQINITVHKLKDPSTNQTLDCPAAFNGKLETVNSVCSVKDRSLYDKCKAAATNAQTNIQKACEIAAPNATNTGPWGAARRCQISKTLPR
jgi:uncharacterized membrane protein (GlpM family)